MTENRPITNFVEQERKAREMLDQHFHELFQNVRAVDPTAAFHVYSDEVVIECSEDKRDTVVRLMRGGL